MANKSHALYIWLYQRTRNARVLLRSCPLTLSLTIAQSWAKKGQWYGLIVFTGVSCSARASPPTVVRALAHSLGRSLEAFWHWSYPSIKFWVRKDQELCFYKMSEGMPPWMKKMLEEKMGEEHLKPSQVRPHPHCWA